MTPSEREKPVSKRQDAVIVGGLLGDLHVQKTSAKTERCRLRFCHSLSQKEYVDWKYKELRDPFCAGTKPPSEKRRGEYLFYTHYVDQFLPYRSKWYVSPPDAHASEGDPLFYGGDGVFRASLNDAQDAEEVRKVVPEDIKDLLVDPISLAVWYLDDGTKRKDSEACRLATQGFSLEENKALADCLEANFAIEAKVEAWRVKGRELYGLSLQSGGSG